MREAADPRWADCEPRLVEAIRDEILSSVRQRITFARFMERALTEPGLGYYATTDRRPTRSGDFLTAPELHPFFGRCIGRFLSHAWREMGEPVPFVVREWGAGRGTLRDDVVEGMLADASPLAKLIAWQPVDVVGRHADPQGERVVGVLLANEFVDALPVHRVAGQGGRLVEYHVTWRDGWFAEVAAEPSTPALAGHLAADGVRLADGQRAEICLAAADWLSAAAAGLERGWLLITDYGHPASELYGPSRLGGTLATYRGHQVGDDPFEAVGRGDITAHVDLTALERAADLADLLPAGGASQAEFLMRLGLGDLLSDLGRRADTEPQTYLDARASVARLVDPRHLGGFRVKRWSRGVPPGARSDASDLL